MSARSQHVQVVWTTTAKECLKLLPPKVRRGLLEKADELVSGGDPREVHKPLVGPLAGYYRITYGRYRAVYTVRESGSSRIATILTVIFVAAGIRKERSKEDVYRLAQKIVDLGIIDPGLRPPPPP